MATGMGKDTMADKKKRQGDEKVEDLKTVKRKFKCLVTGACGFSGSHMVDILLENGYDVVATDIANAPRSWLNPEAKFIPSDLTDKKTIENVMDSVEVIFHTAAVFSYSAPLELLMKVNVQGTKNLFDVAARRGVKKIVMWSTAGVYDVSKAEGQPISEDGPIGPSNNYEYSKLKQEEVAMDYSAAGKLDVCIIRPAPIYGPRNLYGFANIIFGVAKLNLPVLVLPKVNNKAVSVHVEDVSRAALFLAEREDTGGQIYTIVDDSDYTFSEIIKLIAESLGKTCIELPLTADAKKISSLATILARFADLAKRHFPLMFNLPFLETLKYLEEDTARYIAHSFRFSNAKLKSTGYRLKYPDIKDGLSMTLKWYREYGYI